ncbi:MAG: hypothetical protein EZS28_034167 [Streblomastix strix]|uniref:Uncharacterized protein n=1 Tax=Streblomastix strix TaxID=222440 RepID=A0A5J4UHL3_9EUKA|nr:MAG: hypothetical protein EZS28_034167 [Streblomastix strix]
MFSFLHIDQLLDAVQRREKGNIFRLAVDFGLIIERANSNAQEWTIQYKYVLPVNANSERRAPMEIRSQDNINIYKQYLRTVIGSIQERTNSDTHEKIVAIFSIMFFAFRYPLVGAAIPSLKQMPNTKEKRWNDRSGIAEAERLFNSVMGQKFYDNYKGFESVNDIDNFIYIEQLNQHIYIFERDPLHYKLTQNYIVNDSDKQLNILYINDGISACLMYISDVEAITGFRYCNICHKQTFRKNGDKNVMKVILERFPKPFVPHILYSKTYKYLVANYLTNLFKPTQYYISYDIETLEKNVNEKFYDSSQDTATLIPYAIASTVKFASRIYSFGFDIRTDYFLDKWLEQLLEESNKIRYFCSVQEFEIKILGYFEILRVRHNSKVDSYETQMINH